MAKLYQDRDWLWKHYVGRKESSPVMAKEARCGSVTIQRWLHKMNISVYDRNDLWRDRNWLYEHYIVWEESSYAMAKEAKCDPATIYNWLRKWEIPIRNSGEGIFLATRNSVIVIPNLLEFIEGEILGDGHVGILPGGRSAYYSHSSAHEKYLIWLSRHLSTWGIEQSGRITDQISKKTNTIFYRYTSKSYPELISIRKRWYSKRDGKMKKTVPEGFKLTPVRARQWHLGDGCLKHSRYSRPYINLSTCDFDYPSVEHLIEELGKLGFKATHQPARNEIYLSTYSTKEFLAWIGPCPISCYDYRWDYEKHLTNT